MGGGRGGILVRCWQRMWKIISSIRQTRFFDSALFPLQSVDFQADFFFLSQPFTDNRDTLSSWPKTIAKMQSGWLGAQLAKQDHHQAILGCPLVLL